MEGVELLRGSKRIWEENLHIRNSEGISRERCAVDNCTSEVMSNDLRSLHLIRMRTFIPTISSPSIKSKYEVGGREKVKLMG